MKKIVVASPINSLGYGVVGYNICRNIRKNFNTFFYPIGNWTLPTLKYKKKDLETLGSTDMDFYDLYHKSPCFKLWHEHAMIERYSSGPYIGYTFFEKTLLSKSTISQLKSLDVLAVPSEWAVDIIMSQVRHDVKKIHCGVDMNIFDPELSKPNYEKCIFFNCGKWEIRKGHDVLGKAFLEEFKQEKDVELWMMCENPFLNKEESLVWQKEYNNLKIKLINRVDFQENLADIMSNVFCGVFPARSEGWNLELLELMAMGKFTIATNYSAHTEFCNNSNCNLIEIINTEPIYDGKFFTGNNGKWASLSGQTFIDLKSQMRNIYEVWRKNPEEINSNGIKTGVQFSWENSINQLTGILNDIY